MIKFGCDEVQGYLYVKFMLFDVFLVFFEEYD